MPYADKKKALKKQNEWIEQKYDRINLTIPKGQKAVIQEYAAACGMSVNGLIGSLIKAELHKDPAFLNRIVDKIRQEHWENEGIWLDELDIWE